MTCNLDDSVTAASVPGRAGLVEGLIKFSQASSCPTFGNADAIAIANLILNRSLSLDGFEETYRKTCSKEDSIEAGTSETRASTMLDLLAFSQNSTCPTFSDREALDITALVLGGSVNVSSFKSVYSLTCDREVSIEASHSSRKADIFIDLLNYSKNSSCPTLSNSDALKVTDQIRFGHVDQGDFKTTYGHTCDLNVSLEAARCERQH